ncbi:BZ3500_MvSof-1268-A1-R1_Chr11-1g03283 [Microbotryum saponariae]|uniref:BZ3500_MvSof-1268-A1-R1_Chr11-1g03283 protein n=1 Tax=Microbotryum saponariae TaxID=289078 RepID=A0A2X0LWS2_9BASI|nr:BZ3500_MvSof-1268-A1-R1_Chr11-1g03283 [Microbotryum saponariae]
MAPSNYHVVTSPEHLQQVLSTDLTLVSVLYFRADWAETCQQMDQVVQQLVQRWDKVLFLSIEAESLPDISESFEVDAVPYFILLRGHTLLTRLSGAQPSVLASAITLHVNNKAALAGQSTTSARPTQAQTRYDPSSSSSPPPRTTPYPAGDITATRDSDESDEDLTKRCHELMKQSDVVLFMKGDRKTPRCGFSSKIVNILNEQDVEFTTFDILSDDAVRQKLKDLNEWPTFPQLIIKGEFVGGLDVVKEMVENGELKEMLA